MNKLLAISLVLLGLFLPDKMQAQMAVPYKLEKYIDNAGKESKMTEYAKYSFFEGLAMVQNADGSVQYEPDGQPVCYKFKYSKDGYNYYYCYEKQLVMDYINNLYDYQYCFNNNKYLIVSADMTKITSVQKAYTSFGFLIPGYTKVFTQTTDEDIEEYAGSEYGCPLCRRWLCCSVGALDEYLHPASNPILWYMQWRWQLHHLLWQWMDLQPLYQ